LLTKVTIRNFKRFDTVEVELGSPVLFVGPNNSGKTSALQALALWHVGLKRWLEKRQGSKTPEKRPGVTINRRDLIAVPVPSANLLWKDLHTRDSFKQDGTQHTKNVRVEIVVQGITGSRSWECGLEFDYANEESFYCRPLRLTDTRSPERMPIPEAAGSVEVAFLPPMSGLAATETKLEPGAINVRIGEGRTADVLRNLCHEIFERDEKTWNRIVDRIENLFGAVLEAPRYIAERGEVEMGYRDGRTRLDLSSAGRGVQQTLLLLAYMYRNPGTVLLLDEPDAHLEILRQRQIYRLLTDIASQNGNQIVAASHSEVLLNEAGGRDLVIAFLGDPHPISDRGSQLRKSLSEIGFEEYYQAEQTGWVLYLEGSTDLKFLQTFAQVLGHDEAAEALKMPFVKYIGNQPRQVSSHLHGLKEAVPNLKALAIFDRLDQELPADLRDIAIQWKRREIENYVCSPETLLGYARSQAEAASAGPLFQSQEAERWVSAMKEAIEEVETALRTLKGLSPWDVDCKVSDDFLEPLFKAYFKRLNLPNVMAKKNFYELAEHVPREKLDKEVTEKLEAIVRTAKSAVRHT